MTDNIFKKAVKHEAKLRLAIAGPSGSGKTYTSLAVGTALANGGGVAVVDTEHGSASKYADLFEFDVLELAPPFHPGRFVRAIQEAQKAGYSVVILDSLSHAWNGPGGLLEIVDKAAVKFKGNTYAAWSEGTPVQNGLIEGIVGANLHIIATMRSKQDYILAERNGKQVPQKVGMAPVQRDGFEYEFDVFLDMDVDNNAIVSKTRCTALTGQVLPKPGADLAETLRAWLGGAPTDVVDDINDALFGDDVGTGGHTDNGNGPDEPKPEPAPKPVAVAEPDEDVDHFAAALQATDLKTFAEHAWQALDGYDNQFHVVSTMTEKYAPAHSLDRFVYGKTKNAEYLQWLADRKAEEA